MTGVEGLTFRGLGRRGKGGCEVIMRRWEEYAEEPTEERKEEKMAPRPSPSEEMKVRKCKLGFGGEQRSRNQSRAAPDCEAFAPSQELFLRPGGVAALLRNQALTLLRIRGFLFV